MSKKQFFSNNEKAHDFAQKIGSRVDIEGAKNHKGDNTYSVDKSIASYGKDNAYGHKNDPEYKK